MRGRPLLLARGRGRNLTARWFTMSFSISLHLHNNVFIQHRNPLTIKRLVELFSNEEDLVFDPFAGSATTLIAAATMNRRVISYERDPSIYLNPLVGDSIIWRIGLHMKSPADGFENHFRPGTKIQLAFAVLKDNEWHCRQCEYQHTRITQIAGGSGKGLERGTKSRPGLRIDR